MKILKTIIAICILLGIINLVLVLNKIIIFGYYNRCMFFLMLLATIIMVFLKPDHKVYKTLRAVSLLTITIVVICLIPPFNLSTSAFFHNYIIPGKKEEIKFKSEYLISFNNKGLMSCGDKLVLRNSGIIQREYSTIDRDCYRFDSLKNIIERNSVITLTFTFFPDTFVVNIKGNKFIESVN